MKFQKGDPKPEGSGRKPGGQNLITRRIKEVLEAILAEPETEARLRALRDSDEPADRSAFWRLAARLIPNAVAASVDGVREVRYVLHRGPKPEEEPAQDPAGAEVVYRRIHIGPRPDPSASPAHGGAES